MYEESVAVIMFSSYKESLYNFRDTIWAWLEKQPQLNESTNPPFRYVAMIKTTWQIIKCQKNAKI